MIHASIDVSLRGSPTFLCFDECLASSSTSVVALAASSLAAGAGVLAGGAGGVEGDSALVGAIFGVGVFNSVIC